MQGVLIQKLYYSIGEVSDLTNLEKHVLRYWESEFDELKPRKNRAGRRVYTEKDIEVVRRIQFLLKDAKYTLDGARQVLARDVSRAEDDAVMRQELVELRSFLKDLLQQLPDKSEQNTGSISS